ncbi:TonB-dependent receptor plug domain-containing protein [Nodularia chucula]|uniref:TonB-dependent receptor plug domain-containing protein n=1 Tax=Nodularia chucula TaxID=3093667 RepID=UPI0039C73859
MKQSTSIFHLSLTTIILGILSQPGNAQTFPSVASVENLIQQPLPLSEWTNNSHSADALKQINSTSAQIPPSEEEEEEEEKTESDIELLVTGESDNPIQQRLDAPNQVIIIDRQEIERFNDATAGDVLRRLPGVVITGPFDENRDVRLRGFSAGFTQILIDGQQLPDSRDNRQVEVNRIPASAIERIEIIRTPTAGQNSQGVAGTINIVLKQPNRPIGVLDAGVSFLEDRQILGNLNLLYGQKQGDFSYQISAGVLTRGSEKFKDRQTTNANGAITEADIEDDIKNFVDYSFAPRFRWQLSPKDVLRVEPLLFLTNTTRDVERNINSTNFFGNGRLQRIRERENAVQESFKDFTWRMSGVWEHEFNPNAQMNLGLLFQKLEYTQDKTETNTITDQNFNNTPENTPQAISSPSRNTINEIRNTNEQEWLATLGFNFLLGENHRLSTGFEGSFRDRDAGFADRVDVKANYELSEQLLSFYLQDEITLSPNHLLTAGLRLENITSNSTSSDGVNISNSNTELNPSLSYRYRVTPNTNFRLGVARTISRPAFNNLIPFVNQRNGNINQPDELGNPELQPEIAWGVDAGVEQTFGNNTGVIGLNGFIRFIDNLIETQITQDPNTNRFRQQPINIGYGKAYGVELDVKSSMAFIGIPNLNLSSNFSLLGSQIQDSVTGESRPFNEQPNYVMNLGFDYAIPEWNMTFGVNYNFTPQIEWEQLAGTNTQRRITKSISSLNAFVAFQLQENLNLRFYGRNIGGINSDRINTTFNQQNNFVNELVDLQSAPAIYGFNLSWNF